MPGARVVRPQQMGMAVPQSMVPVQAEGKHGAPSLGWSQRGLPVLGRREMGS